MASRPSPGNTPPEYPGEYRHRIVLPDGRRLLIRPVLPADAALLGAALRAADPEEIWRIFPEGVPGRPDEWVRAVIDAGYRDHFALVAYDAAGTVVGVSRYERAAGERTAFLRLIVQPPWRRAGVGRELLWSLATRAQECGIDVFTGLARRDNEAFRAFVAESGGTMDVHDDVAQVSMVIDWSRAPL